MVWFQKEAVFGLVWFHSFFSKTFALHHQDTLWLYKFTLIVQAQELWGEMIEKQVWAGHEQTSTRQTEQIVNGDQPLLQSTGSQTSVCVRIT